MKHDSAIAVLEGKINNHQEKIWDYNDLIDHGLKEMGYDQERIAKETKRLKRIVNGKIKLIEKLNQSIKFLKENNNA